MRKSASLTLPTSLCPVWCNDHLADSDGQSHVAATVTTDAGHTISMHQVLGGHDTIFTADDQPTIWLNDVPMTIAAAAEAAAVLAGLVAAALVGAR
jgi:hypothetical protein